MPSNLVEIVRSNASPGFAWPKALPFQKEPIQCFRKTQPQTSFSIELGTDARRGIFARTNHYINGTIIPKFMEKSADRKIPYIPIGLMCTIPLPQAIRGYMQHDEKTGTRWPLIYVVWPEWLYDFVVAAVAFCFSVAKKACNVIISWFYPSQNSTLSYTSLIQIYHLIHLCPISSNSCFKA